MARTLVNMPTSAKRGDVIEIRTLIAHPMETGWRPGSDGKILPRNLIRRLICTFDDGANKSLVFSADMFPAVAANPYFAFYMAAVASGTLSLTWEGDNGFSQTETAVFTVT